MFVTGQWRTLLFYDGLGRKRMRREYNWVSGAWNLTNEVRYLYDGFLLLQERNSANVPRVSYTRGIDLSGSFSGAGGIGGLLGMTTHAQTTNYTHYFYHSDALGNITALQDTNKVIQAKWAYEPWGQLFSMSGPLTNLNRMRQSGKEWHPQSGLMDFGARLYHPTWQRWMNEDPLGIAGGLNLYRYVGNSPFNYVDPYGLLDLGVGSAAAASKLAEALAAAEAAAAGGAGGVTLSAALGYGLPTAAAGGLLGYGVGHYTGLHDWLAEKLVPDNSDSSPLPLPAGSMKPPRTPGKPPTTTAPCPYPGNFNWERQRAVEEAWRQEAELVRRTGRGTRDWTESEKAELLRTSRVTGYHGHHINSVASNPHMAGNPHNIQFVRAAEHLKLHGGNWRNPTWGELIYR